MRIIELLTIRGCSKTSVRSLVGSSKLVSLTYIPWSFARRFVSKMHSPC